MQQSHTHAKLPGASLWKAGIPEFPTGVTDLVLLEYFGNSNKLKSLADGYFTGTTLFYRMYRRELNGE